MAADRKRRLVVWFEKHLQNPPVRLALLAGLPLPPLALLARAGVLRWRVIAATRVIRSAGYQQRGGSPACPARCRTPAQRRRASAPAETAPAGRRRQRRKGGARRCIGVAGAVGRPGCWACCCLRHR